MAKTIKKDPEIKSDKPNVEKGFLKISRQQKLLFGCLLVLFSIALLVAFVSFFIHGNQDQSSVTAFGNRDEIAGNWLGKFGAIIADFFIFKGFGAASFLLVKLFFLTGAFLVLDISLAKLKKIWFWDLFVMIVLSVLFGYFAVSIPELGGTIGFEMNSFLQDYIGKIGTLLILIFGIIIYLIFKIKISPDTIKSFFEKKKTEITEDLKPLVNSSEDPTYNLEEFAVNENETDHLTTIINNDDEDIAEPALKPVSQFEINKEGLKPTISNSSEIKLETTPKYFEPEQKIITPHPTSEIIKTEDDVFVIEKALEDDIVEENLAQIDWLPISDCLIPL